MAGAAPMIRPEPSTPDRQKLAEQIAWLPTFLLRGGAKSADELVEMAEQLEKKGANRTEVLQETSKFTNPDFETGLFRNPEDKWLFELHEQPDLTPEAMQHLFAPSGTAGASTNTPIALLDQYYVSPELFNRVPELKKVLTKLEYPAD